MQASCCEPSHTSYRQDNLKRRFPKQFATLVHTVLYKTVQLTINFDTPHDRSTPCSVARQVNDFHWVPSIGWQTSPTVIPSLSLRRPISCPAPAAATHALRWGSSGGCNQLRRTSHMRRRRRGGGDFRGQCASASRPCARTRIAIINIDGHVRFPHRHFLASAATSTTGRPSPPELLR